MKVILIAIAASCVMGSGTRARAPRPQVVEVAGGDYAFMLPPAVHAGPTIFRFVNRGQVRHELSIALLRPGATMQQYMMARQAKTRPGQLIEASVGVILADAGTRGAAGLGTTLLAGREYVVICDSKDSPGAPQHSALGMFASLHVAAGDDSSVVATRVDTIVGTDYAFRHAETLAAGHHSLAFVNAGTQRHELKIFLLPQGQTLKAFMEEHAQWRSDRTGGASPANSALAVLVATRGVTPLGTVELDLEPGREYAMTCDFADSADAPEHTMLGMFGSIRVQLRK